MIFKPNISTYTLENLRTTLNSELDWKTEHFEAFRAAVSRSAEKHLEVHRSRKEQDPARWACFMTEVVTNVPELSHFEDNWPVLLISRALQNRVKNYSRKHTTAPRSVVVNSMSSRDKAAVVQVTSEAAKQRRLFIGKPPPRRIRFQRGHSNIGQAANNPDSQSSLTSSSSSVDPEPSTAISASSAHLDKHFPAPSLTTSMGLAEFHRDSQVLSGSVKIGHSDPVGTVACLFCEHVPSIPAGATVEISCVFRDRTIVEVLSQLGINNDRQFRILRRWEAQELERFITSVPTHLAGALYKTCILKHLLPNPSPATQRTHLIPQPSLEVENILMNSPESPLPRIIGVMRNQDVIHQIDEIERLVSEGWPWTALKNEICEQFTFLKRFSNCWPVFFHIKWRKENMHSQASGSRPYTARSVAWRGPSPPLFEPMRQDDNATVPQSGCPLHPPTDWNRTPTKLQALLKALDMEELMPLFLAAHVRSNVEFKLLSELDEVERTSVFEQLDLRHVKPFQRWMLHVVLKNLTMLD